MNRRLGTLALALVMTLALGASPAPSNPPQPESQDILFFGDQQPIFLRFDIQVDGQGFQTAWLEAMRRLHGFMDTNGDGRLSAAECERGSWLKRLQTQGMMVSGRRVSRVPATSRGHAPAGPANVVTAEDLANALRPTFGPMQLLVNLRNDAGSQTLFGHLDRDGDKTLTNAEITSADASLRAFDVDDDEMIELMELEPYRNPYFRSSRPLSNDPPPVQGVNPPFVLLSPQAPRTALVRRLLATYDRAEKDGRLTRPEIGLDKDAFDRADGDGDGGLDADELLRFLGAITPNLELDVSIRKQVPTQVKVVTPASGPTEIAARVRATADEGLAIILETVRIEIGTGGRRGVVDARQFYRNQFRAADTDNSKSLDKEEALRNGSFDAETFALMDRDGDGKVFLEEMDAGIGQEADTAASRTLLSATEFGQPLFEALDLSGDRRLSVRELREALKRVAAWDRDRDGRIGVSEIPRHYRLVFGRGQPGLVARSGFVPDDNAMANPRVNWGGPGPAWFSRMDRNNDGDVSRREFLGTLAEFRRLDADHDGLLDAREARNAR